MLAAILILVCFVQLIGYWASESGIRDWYTKLNQPGYLPPEALFSSIWTLLYLLMGLSLWLVWKEETPHSKKWAYIFFFGQLFFNLLWSILFFWFRSPLLALIDVYLLNFFLIGTIYTFLRIHKWAAIMLLPYFCWTLYALALNITIWAMNRY